MADPADPSPPSPPSPGPGGPPCPRCGAPRPAPETPACPRCGVIYAKALRRAARGRAPVRRRRSLAPWLLVAVGLGAAAVWVQRARRGIAPEVAPAAAPAVPSAAAPGSAAPGGPALADAPPPDPAELRGAAAPAVVLTADGTATVTLPDGHGAVRRLPAGLDAWRAGRAQRLRVWLRPGLVPEDGGLEAIGLAVAAELGLPAGPASAVPDGERPSADIPALAFPLGAAGAPVGELRVFQVEPDLTAVLAAWGPEPGALADPAALLFLSSLAWAPAEGRRMALPRDRCAAPEPDPTLEELAAAELPARLRAHPGCVTLLWVFEPAHPDSEGLAPRLDRLARARAPEGFVLIPVALDTNPGRVAGFYARHPLLGPRLRLSAGADAALPAALEALGAPGAAPPALIAVDRDGQLIATGGAADLPAVAEAVRLAL